MALPAKGRLSNVHAGKENANSAGFLKDLPKNGRYRANDGEVFRIVEQGLEFVKLRLVSRNVNADYPCLSGPEFLCVIVSTAQRNGLRGTGSGWTRRLNRSVSEVDLRV